MKEKKKEVYKIKTENPWLPTIAKDPYWYSRNKLNKLVIDDSPIPITGTHHSLFFEFFLLLILVLVTLVTQHERLPTKSTT